MFRIIFKTIFLAFLTFTMQGCSNNNMKQFENTKPQFDLFNFFKGKSIAYGIFEDRFGKLRRQFRVNITGTINNNTLILDEKFLYDDGEKSSRIWKIKNISDKTSVKYKGRAEDIEGFAEGKTIGNAFNWSYHIYLNMKGTNLKVKFNDWIYQQDKNIAINRAYVSKFGIDIGSVTLVFLRGETFQSIGKLDMNTW